jgi:hypothetical protein
MKLFKFHFLSPEKSCQLGNNDYRQTGAQGQPDIEGFFDEGKTFYNHTLNEDICGQTSANRTKIGPSITILKLSRIAEDYFTKHTNITSIYNQYETENYLQMSLKMLS